MGQHRNPWIKSHIIMYNTMKESQIRSVLILACNDVYNSTGNGWLLSLPAPWRCERTCVIHNSKRGQSESRLQSTFFIFVLSCGIKNLKTWHGMRLGLFSNFYHSIGYMWYWHLKLMVWHQTNPMLPQNWPYQTREIKLLKKPWWLSNNYQNLLIDPLTVFM